MNADLSLPSLPDRPATVAPRRPWPAWLREPLLHFVVLGGLLFAVDHVLVGRVDDPHVIVVGPEVDRDARAVFAAARNRDPEPAEMTALRKVWLDNEVLYREGLALQVDKGDSAIRERVIFKALSVIDASTKLPAFDDAVLRRWFDQHRAKYDEPARVDFLEAVMSGDTSESAVRSFVAALNAGTPGDAKAGLRVFKGRPVGTLVQSYGAGFAQALDTAPVGEWRAIAARDGWRAIRVEARSVSTPADFAALRDVVRQDWTDATMSEQRSAAVQALARKYTLRTDAAASR